jgi:predicted RNA-binding Zn-ribbon protein involved in translation (DUF1610 family)
MEGIIWFFLALIVALIAIGFVLAGLRRRQSSMEHDPARCTSCETPISPRRVSIFQSLALRGVSMCPHCGTRINRTGKQAGTVA